MGHARFQLGRNIIHLAADNGDVEMGEALLAKLDGALDLNAATAVRGSHASDRRATHPKLHLGGWQDGWTAQHYAALQGHSEFEELLRIHNHQSRGDKRGHEYEMQKQLLESFRESKTWAKVSWRVRPRVLSLCRRQ